MNIPQKAIEATANTLYRQVFSTALSTADEDAQHYWKNQAADLVKSASPFIGAEVLRTEAERLLPDPEWECFVGSPEEGRLGAVQDLLKRADELEAER